MARHRKKPATGTSPPPLALHPFDSVRDRAGLALLFIAAFTLFAVSTPRTVMLEDDGLFVCASYFAGVVHPPGYPLFVALGWLASHIPFGSVAWRVHALSGAMGAITCLCIAWLVFRRTGSRPAAYLAGGALAVSEHFWSQAIIADVYTLNTALLFVSLALAQEAAAKRDARLWLATAVVYGLGLANHWPLFILGSPLLIAPALAAGKNFRNRIHYLLPVTLLTAAAFYGWMVWRSHQPLAVNFLGPIESWEAFAAFISRAIYATTDASPSADFTDKLLYARYFTVQSLLQFTVPGGLVALWGLIRACQTGHRFNHICEAAAFAGSLVLIALLGFDYEYLTVEVFRPYLLVAYCILALWLGYGIHGLAQKISARRRLLPAFYGALALVVAGLCIGNAGANFRPHDRFAAEQAQLILDLMEKDATLIAYGDMYTFPIAYLQLIEGRRPDVRALNYSGQMLSDRVVEPLQWKWDRSRVDAKWREFIRTSERPVYTTSSGPTLSDLGQRHLAFIKRTDASLPRGDVFIRADDRLKGHFKKLLAMADSENRWATSFRNEWLELYGRYLGYVQMANNPELDEYIADVLPAAQNNYWSLTGMIRAFLKHGGGHRLAAADAHMQKAKQLADERRNKSQIAELLYMEGLIEKRKGNNDKAMALFARSGEINRSFSNQARRMLEQMRTRSGRS